MTIPVGYGIATIHHTITGNANALDFTFGFKPDPGLSGNPATMAALFDVAWKSTGSAGNASQRNDQSDYRGVTITYQSSTGPVGYVLVTAIAGALTFSSTVDSVAMILEKITGRGGRKGRGRCYVPPIRLPSAAISSNGDLNPPDVAIWQPTWNTFWTNCNGTGVPLYLLHADGSTPDVITSLLIPGYVGTQRRRIRR